ncbi:cysteine-rich DPF motif domain-containing protein 1 [Anastrepha obliqua]|uniref:cysteine-rich DPF motif domain-containing protein 1 n=1 Tax=Anastrepha obliqua TaxID=95512 RepID=UPI00240A6D84|nr:cysteine-rich DPF motif domain-containing protein 1 [Anastrepha obliqua]
MDEVKSSNESVDNYINNYDDLQLNVKDEEAEIARLEIPVPNITGTEKCEFQNDDRTPKIEFQCTACDMLEMVHYYGKIPPFVYGLKLLEDSFVMRDPFQPPPLRWKPKAEYFVILGAKCSMCENVVCRSTECSFYYTHTYCLSCAEINRSKFPQEAQAKLRKQFVQKNK